MMELNITKKKKYHVMTSHLRLFNMETKKIFFNIAKFLNEEKGKTYCLDDFDFVVVYLILKTLKKKNNSALLYIYVQTHTHTHIR